MGVLYLIRHGEPELNGEKRCIGTTDVPLSEKGREDIRETRLRLKDADIRHIYVSSLSRALESAGILSGGNIPITVMPELGEIHMGVWENLTFSEIKERYPAEYEARGNNFADFKPEGGESFRECQERAYLAYRKILAEAEGNIAVVAHAGFNRALISFLENRDLKDLMNLPQAYGSIYSWNIGPKLGAVILAAGRSSRMGKLKPLLPIGEDCLILREIKNLFRAGTRQITVVTGREPERIRRAASGPGVSFVHNDGYETTGMFESACMALREVPPGMEGIFFLPADAPMFSLFTLRKLQECFFRRGEDIFRPVYRNQPGHPIVIRHRIFEEILRYSGDKGLQGFCSRNSSRVFSVSVPDPGILMDADRPEDYERILTYEQELRIPSRERCLDILMWRELPEKIIGHCKAVAAKAVELAEAYNRQGGNLNLALVEAGGLLHDLERLSPKHAGAGADVLRQLGFVSTAEVVLYHEHLPEKLQRTINEISIVYLADKLLLGTTPCTLKERYESRRKEYTEDEEALRAIQKKQRTAEMVYEQYRNSLKGSKG